MSEISNPSSSAGYTRNIILWYLSISGIWSLATCAIFFEMSFEVLWLGVLGLVTVIAALLYRANHNLGWKLAFVVLLLDTMSLSLFGYHYTFFQWLFIAPELTVVGSDVSIGLNLGLSQHQFHQTEVSFSIAINLVSLGILGLLGEQEGLWKIEQ